MKKPDATAWSDGNASLAATTIDVGTANAAVVQGNLRLLFVLLVVAGGIRIWLMAHTAVIARDGIGFIRYAWQLEHQPWPEVLRGSAQHPLYPMSVLLMSLPIRHWMHAPLCDAMALSAQAAGCLAAVLIVVPMFYLGQALFDRSVGFWAALLFQCLPVGARATSDALSEGLFLLLVATALLFAAHALRRRSVFLFAGCGLFGGLAYLTRPEGALTTAAAGLVLMGMQAFPSWRWPWRHSLACAACLGLSTLAMAGPYMAVIKNVTPKVTAQDVLGLPTSEQRSQRGLCQSPATAFLEPASVRYHRLWHGPVAGPIPMANLAVWSPEGLPTDFVHQLLWSLWAVATEVVKGYHYIAWLAALTGFYWYRQRMTPEAWVLLVLCILLILALWRLAFTRGYVAERHVLILVLCGLYWAVAAIRDLPQRLLAWRAAVTARWPPFRAQSPLPVLRLSPRMWSVVVLLALAGSGLPKTLKPLHPERAGHRTAGQWLARHAEPPDMLEDPFYWAYYYAGWVFLENAPGPPAPSGHAWAHYIVVERSAHPHPRLSLIPQEIVKKSEPVTSFPLQPGKAHGGNVCIYTINWTRKRVMPPAHRNVP